MRQSGADGPSHFKALSGAEAPAVFLALNGIAKAMPCTNHVPVRLAGLKRRGDTNAVLLHALFSKGLQDKRAADREATHRTKRHQLSPVHAPSQQIGEQRPQCKSDSQHIQPDRGMHRCSLRSVAQAQLHQHGHQTDGSNHHNRQGTVEGVTVGENDDQRESPAEQA